MSKFSFYVIPHLVLLLLCSQVTFAKNPPDVQYINMAPLPGAGNALNQDGKPDGQGAMQLNIPVAYTPGNGYVDVGISGGEYTRDISNKTFENGTGVIGLGFFTWPRFYASGMAVSGIIFHDSKALNGQVQVTKETAHLPAMALGAQDVLNKESGDSPNANTGISFYGVATKRFMFGKTTLYGTAGYGAARFEDTVFYGVSWPISDQFTLAAENDGFQFNAVAGWRPWGRFSHVTLLTGYNGKAGVLVGAHATGKIPSYWAIPIYILFMRR